MSGRVLNFPFSAVVGTEAAKKALECLLADDSLNGVLIKGPSGTAKSVLVRALTSLTDKKIIDLPAGAGDEDIFGGIDFETAVKEGKSVLKGGLLERANNNILCIDNVNLLDPRTLNTVMECLSTGKVKVEREGISAEYECNTSVVATMDPAERDLPESIADRFDICVLIPPSQDIGERSDIVEREFEFRRDPVSFSGKYAQDDAEIKHKIECARSKIPSIKITRRDINDIVIVCNKVNAIGHRGDIACARVARALAALDGQDYIGAEHIRDASVLCLQHRRKPKLITSSDADAYTYGSEGDKFANDDPEKFQATKEEIAELVKMSKEEDMDIDAMVEEYDPESDAETPAATVTELEEEDDPDDVPDMSGEIPDIEITTKILCEVQTDLAEIDRIELIHLNKVVGQIPRAVMSGRRNGRTSGYRIPAGKTSDPALSPTIRAAAPYQKYRKPNGLSVIIEPSDIRENVRTKASSCSFMFVLDVSGSLSQTGRLEEAIKAVRAMLEDGYVRRDRVGLLTFGQRNVNLAVPMTRNVEAVFDAIEKTVTGGSTPLGSALLMLNKYMTNYVRKNPDEQCYVIMITDGEADTSVVVGTEPNAEVRRICATIKIPRTQWIVIDNGSLSRRVNYAMKLANYLNGRYIDINDLL